MIAGEFAEKTFSANSHKWDDVALFCHPDEYRLGIFPMVPGDVAEVDSLRELAALDPAYQAYLETEE